MALAAGSPGLAVSLDLEVYDKRRAAMLALVKVAAGAAPFASWIPVSEAIGRSKSEKLDFYLKVLYDLLRDLLLLHEGGGEIRNQDIRRELEALAAQDGIRLDAQGRGRGGRDRAFAPPEYSEDHRARCADYGVARDVTARFCRTGVVGAAPPEVFENRSTNVPVCFRFSRFLVLFPPRRFPAPGPVLSYFSTFGSQSGGAIQSLALDAPGNIYVTGTTTGTIWVNPIQSTPGRGNCSPEPGKTFNACEDVFAANSIPLARTVLSSASHSPSGVTSHQVHCRGHRGQCLRRRHKRAPQFSWAPLFPRRPGFPPVATPRLGHRLQPVSEWRSRALSLRVDGQGNAYLAGASLGAQLTRRERASVPGAPPVAVRLERWRLHLALPPITACPRWR